VNLVHGEPKARIPYGSMRNQCPSCDQLFNSLSAFEAHRLGPYPRRCLESAEMAAKGMLQQQGGWWIETARGNAIPGRDAATRIDANRLAIEGSRIQQSESLGSVAVST
jgi:hypothetical protein